MKGRNVTIVDYGLGNLFSVKRAFEVCGVGTVNVTQDPKIIASSERLVLPGVGSFSDGMIGLRRNGLDQAVFEFASTRRPFQISSELRDMARFLLPDCLTRSVYLIHSYQFIPDSAENILATYRYGGADITAAIYKDNIFGFQFHPEKSGKLGIEILSRFMML